MAVRAAEQRDRTATLFLIIWMDQRRHLTILTHLLLPRQAFSLFCLNFRCNNRPEAAVTQGAAWMDQLAANDGLFPGPSIPHHDYISILQHTLYVFVSFLWLELWHPLALAQPAASDLSNHAANIGGPSPFILRHS